MQRAETERDRLLYSVSIGLIVVGLLLGFAILPRAFTPPEAAGVGKDAPNFALPIVLNAPSEKAAIALNDLRGHAVLLDFWATWCGPCRAEAPLVDRVARRFRDRGLVVVGVNTSDDEGNAAPFARSHGLSFPIAFDEGNLAARAYGVDSLPTLVVIGKDGKVRAVRTGMTDDAELSRLVTEAL